MGNLQQAKYSNRFKAKIALKARGNGTFQQLSQKHAIPKEQIKRWVKQLDERAELLFVGQDTPNQTKAIQNHAALLRTTLEASPNGILVTDLSQNIITYNQKCVEMWQVPEHIIASGKTDKAVKYILGMVKNAGVLQKSIKKVQEDPAEKVNHIIALKDGRFFERHAVPYRVEGEIVGRVTNFVDITEYKKTEEKLSQYDRVLHSINTNVNEGILRSTPEKGLIYVNDAFVKMFGYNSREEVLATDPAKFYASEQNRWELVKRLQKEGGFDNAEVIFKSKDGSAFWGLENSTLVKSNGHTYIDSVVTDIDEWKHAEQALRKSEEKYRKILKTIEEGYFEIDLSGHFTFFNAALVDIIGYPAKEMIGMNNRQYMDPDTAQKVFETFNEVYTSGQPRRGFDWQIIRGDGGRIFVEVSIKIRTDEQGNTIGFRGMVRDITDRKQKQKQIRQSLKEKEVLLGEIHHRVKNNLAVISGLLYLQADKTKDKQAYRALMESQNRINSMALIHELLYDNKTFSSLNPRAYIQQLVEHISSNFSTGNVDIETKIEAENFDLEMSTAIPCALIINELLTNAFKYAFKDRERGMVKIIFYTTANGYHLEVVDNGRGLPSGFDIWDDNQHSLGLSLVKTLSRQLRGKLQVKNGLGARFIIDFTG